MLDLNDPRISLVRLLGQGGMATVHLARERATEETEEIPATALFILIGAAPKTRWSCC